MEIMLEALFEMFGELIWQLLFELLADLGVRLKRKVFEESSPIRPVYAALSYAALGACFGFVSSLIYSGHLFKGRTAAALYLVFAPIVAGLVMAAIGRWRQQRNGQPIRLERFFYGWLFALSFALVRIWFRHL